MAIVRHGLGLRPMECLGLRFNDIDFTRHEVLLGRGKGNEDRVTAISTHVLNRGGHDVQSQAAKLLGDSATT
jgi:integrase